MTNSPFLNHNRDLLVRAFEAYLQDVYGNYRGQHLSLNACITRFCAEANIPKKVLAEALDLA